ncbi:hypothetical protein ACJDU8_23475 [Clostridium sp. WILCCON 0269]|uniref:Uncharacterized protein n=1 Tax=Candidatus Clostridium eludens TaxID=3381663 RepID=A0ABW8SWC2_9CLOT
MKIRISDEEHTFVYDNNTANVDIKQDKHSTNYCKLWGIKKFVNPTTQNIKYILESEENVPMYGDTTIHRLAEFFIKNEKIDLDSIYVEETLKVNIENEDSNL